nr:MAG TPA: hypothetical protein [Caudoviricetes sp.]
MLKYYQSQNWANIVNFLTSPKCYEKVLLC